MLSFWNSTICTKKFKGPPTTRRASLVVGGGTPGGGGLCVCMIHYIWVPFPPPPQKKKYTHSHSIGNKNQSGCILMLYKFIAGSLGWAINTVVPFSLTGIISNFISHLPILYLFNFQLFAWLPRNTPWIMKIAADFSLTIGNFLAISEHLAFF